MLLQCVWNGRASEGETLSETISQLGRVWEGEALPETFPGGERKRSCRIIATKGVTDDNS
jgi:hypothetical protein